MPTQGCVVIFLSNFLALLIKVDAAGEENRAALGGILIAMNVLLILAVLATSWFATQQSVDDHREEETSLTLAKTMLTFEQRTADTARLARDQKKQKETEKKEKKAAPSSSSSSSSVGPRPASSRARPGGSAGKNGAGAVPRGGSVSTVTVKALWEEGKNSGKSTSYS